MSNTPMSLPMHVAYKLHGFARHRIFTALCTVALAWVLAGIAPQLNA